MIAIEMLRRFWLPAAILLVAAAAFFFSVATAYNSGREKAGLEWQAKWDKQALQLAEAKAKAVELVHEEEQRRQRAIDEVRQHAEQQIARAEADAAAADAAADSLRDTAERLAARAGQCASHPTATESGKAAAQPSVVLADVLGRADQRAGQLAAAYDRARAAGLACEAAYDALRNERQGQ